MRRCFPLGLIFTLVLLYSVVGTHRPRAVLAQAQQVWEVQVGGDVPGTGISTASFWPDVLTIHAGDTLRWTFVPSSQQHLVFIQPAGRPIPALYLAGPGAGEYTLSPAWFPSGPTGPDAIYDDTQAANSGADFDGADTAPYMLSFTKPGVYQYNCTLHLGMQGRVAVVPSDVAVPETSAQAQSRGQTQFTNRVANFNAFVLTPPPSSPTATVPVGDIQARAGAGALHTVVAGLGYGGLVNALQFLPGNLTVQRGDLIVWYNSDGLNHGHTVTFTSGAPPPDYPTVRSQVNGQPLFVLTADTVGPAGGGSYGGQGYVNSGFLGLGRTFALTIDAPPGTYQYVCLVHRDVMNGTITVVDTSR